MGCSCGGGAKKFTYQTLIQKDGSILATLKYIHCAYNEEFVKAFKNIGIDVTDESRLKTLASLADTGNDLKGYATDKNNKPIVFSVEEILKTIDISKPTKNNCSI